MSSNKPKKIIISGYYGFNNFGDDAVLSVLVNSLKNENVKPENITIISRNPKNTKKIYGTKSVYYFNLLSVFFSMLKSDILFSGGGSLLQDVTSSKSLFYYLFIISLALILGKKVIIFAQGIGPVNNKFSQKITKFILKKCSYVTVRDEKSLNLLKEWGVDADLVPDPVWNLPVGKRYPHNILGIQLRTWKTLTENMITALAKSVAEAFSDKKIFIYALQKSQDKEVCLQFEEKLNEFSPNTYTQIIAGKSPSEITASFSQLDLLIAMRYHACLIGLKYKMNVLPIVYDPKVESLADEFGLTNRIYLRDEQEADTAIKLFQSQQHDVNEKPLPQFDFSSYAKFLK